MDARELEHAQMGFGGQLPEKMNARQVESLADFFEQSLLPSQAIRRAVAIRGVVLHASNENPLLWALGEDFWQGAQGGTGGQMRMALT